MKQNIFETKQRAAELMAQAVNLWQKSERSEYLEGLDKDPVFKLLMNAIAYQANELDSEIDQLKVDLLDELKLEMFRGEGGKAIPSAVPVSVAPVPGAEEQTLNSNHNFILKADTGRSFNYIPLVKIKTVGVSVKSVTRTDARRWSVKVEFASPVKNMSGMSFGVKGSVFRNLRVFEDNTEMEIPLISPWEYANYPMTDYFSLQTLLYNRSQAVSLGEYRSCLSPYSSFISMDMLANQDFYLFVVDDMQDMEPRRSMNLVFEFDGISDTFSFTAASIFFNATILVNAAKKSVIISSSSPIARIAGDDDDNRDQGQFLHLLRPPKDEMYSFPIQIRKISADRFNRGRLVKLLNNILAKYHSDFYAFQSIGVHSADVVMRRIRKDLSDLISKTNLKAGAATEGIYAILDSKSIELKVDSNVANEVIMEVGYLVTDGAAVEELMRGKVRMDTPQGFDADATRLISGVLYGIDEIRDRRTDNLISKFYMMTEDRLVTPYDLKLFCHTELVSHYGLVEDMINSIVVKHAEITRGRYHSATIRVDICLKDNEFTKRAFEGKLADVETRLQKLMEVRSTGIYPIEVHISIDVEDK